jgi:hypothetical protein
MGNPTHRRRPNHTAKDANLGECTAILLIGDTLLTLSVIHGTRGDWEEADYTMECHRSGYSLSPTGCGCGCSAQHSANEVPDVEVAAWTHCGVR